MTNHARGSGRDLDFALCQRGSHASWHYLSMPPFIYRCPNTARNVQGFVADDPSDGDHDSYEGIICTACGRFHLVNPKTAKVLGSHDDWG